MPSEPGRDTSYWDNLMASTQVVMPPPVAPPSGKAAKAPKQPKPAKAPKASKQPKAVKPPRPPKAPKAIKPPKVAKPPREPKELAEKPPSRRRVLKVALVVVLLGVCAAVPWVAPQVPDWFGSKVPKTVNVPVRVPDPTVAPPAQPKGKEVIPAAGLVGSRLAAAGVPLEVVVKRLKVRSDVIPISGQSGELLPPSDPVLLGWWQEGRVAGSVQGSVVVTGHTVHTGGGAFDHLGELRPADKVRVRTSAGWISYVVVQSQTLTTKQLAKRAQDIFQLYGDGHLVLITCSDFNGSIYLSNSVVYAVPVADEPFNGPRTTLPSG